MLQNSGIQLPWSENAKSAAVKQIQLVLYALDPHHAHMVCAHRPWS